MSSDDFTLQKVRQFWWLFAFVEELIEWDLKRARQFFQCFNSRDSVAILYAGNITAKQAGSLLRCRPEKVSFAPHFAEPLANNHWGIIASTYGPEQVVALSALVLILKGSAL